MVRRKYRSRVRLNLLSSFDVFADINRGVHDRSYRGVEYTRYSPDMERGKIWK